MQITQLRKITDRKYKVILEDDTSFVLYAGEARKYGISAGADLPEQTLREIMDEVLTKRAKLRCMHLLTSMDRTQAQLRERLERDGYPEEITQRALAYAASFHYTDDRRYAGSYIRQHADKRSRQQIEFELMQKGVSREEIRQAYEDHLQDTDGEDPEVAAVRALASKRGFDPETAGPEESRKLIRYLMGKGFRMPAIREALRGS